MKTVVAILVVLLLVLQFRLWVGDGSLAEVARLTREMNEQREENATFRERNQILDAEVRDLKEGLEAVEERARRELGMIGPGETYFQIVEQ